MAVTLVAIALSFWQAEGCGGRFQIAANLVYAPDGKSLAVCSYDWGDANVSMKVYIADCDRFISIYRTDEGTSQVIHRDFRGGVLGPGRSHYCYTPLQFTPNGQSLYFPSWDGDQVLQWTAENSRVLGIAEGARQFFAFTWDTDRERLFAGFYDHLTVIEPASKSKKEFALANPINSFRDLSMAISPDGRWLAMAGDHVEVWDIRSTPQATYSNLAETESWRPRGISFSSDSSRLAVGCQDRLTIVDLQNGKTTTFAKGMELGWVTWVPNSEVVIASGELIRCIDLLNGQIKSLDIEPRWLGAMALSADGAQLAVCTRRGIELWDWANCARTAVFPLPRSHLVRWYLPWIALGAWLLVARRMWQNRSTQQPRSANAESCRGQ